MGIAGRNSPGWDGAVRIAPEPNPASRKAPHHRHPDGETLRFDLEPVDFNEYGFDLVWRALVADPAADPATNPQAGPAGGREVARGKLGILFFDYGIRRPAPIPSPFLERLGGPADRTKSDPET